MFSYFLHNPNNFFHHSTEKYNVIPFGHRCSSALVCKYASVRHFSLPFDWTIPLFPNKIQQVLENDFKDYIPKDIHNNVFRNIYDIELSHFNSDINEGIAEYERRIKRFSTIMNEHNKLFFVYINEDFLYDPSYRTDEFNNSIFTQMLELETFLKSKYPNLNYNILYFNFKQHDIPPSSNIINFVIKAEYIYDAFYPDYAESFRNFCGEVLSNFFDTQLQLGYTHETFLN